MIAAKLLIVVLAIICAAIVSADFSLDTPKCKLSAAGKTTLMKCFKEETGKDFDPATFVITDVTPTQKEAIVLCSAKKTGIVGADGKTFNAAKATESVDSLEAETAIKEAIKTGITDCAGKGGDATAIFKCNHGVFMANCK